MPARSSRARRSRDLFADPQHPYTIGLLGSIPRLDVERERLATIEGTVPSAHNQPKGCRFAPRCPFADRRCHEEPPPLRDITPGIRSPAGRRRSSWRGARHEHDGADAQVPVLEVQDLVKHFPRHARR